MEKPIKIIQGTAERSGNAAYFTQHILLVMIILAYVKKLPFLTALDLAWVIFVVLLLAVKLKACFSLSAGHT